MARIRSVHPGLFTDEAFVALSSDAQVFLIGLWTEADDQGVFEWKPVRLRMRLRPTKDGDVASLLGELLDVDIICKYEMGGRFYGAIRNFRRYQRPKSPNAAHPITDEIRKYTALTSVISEVGHDDAVQFPSNAETDPQREEEGEGGREKDSRRVAKATPPNLEFEEFWKSYPSRKGDNPKAPARKVFEAAVKQGADPQAIIAGVKAACARNQEKIGTEFIPQAVKWLRDRRWEDYAGAQAQPPANDVARYLT